VTPVALPATVAVVAVPCAAVPGVVVAGVLAVGVLAPDPECAVAVADRAPPGALAGAVGVVPGGRRHPKPRLPGARL
jgi:hypothetical protein